METPNYRKGSIYFDDETVLEVTQRGGGGSGVGGETGLAAVNLITGESTNAALAAKDETIAAQAGEITDLEDEVAAKQAIIDAFPTIEALSVTANGTYSEAGKAYSPVTVNLTPEGYIYKGAMPLYLNFKTNSGNIKVLHAVTDIIAGNNAPLTGPAIEINRIGTATSSLLCPLNAAIEGDNINRTLDLFFIDTATSKVTITPVDATKYNILKETREGGCVIRVRFMAGAPVPASSTVIGTVEIDTTA